MITNKINYQITPIKTLNLKNIKIQLLQAKI
jgi:hypothetical protein